MGFPGSLAGKESACNARRPWFDPWVEKIPLEKGEATHSSILAWRIPMDRGAWRATVHKVTNSWTRLSNSAQHTVPITAPNIVDTY